MDSYDVSSDVGNVADYFMGEPYNLAFKKGPHSPKNETEEAALEKLVELGMAKKRKTKGE